MRNRLLFLLKYYLFWIALSVLAKVLFLLYQGNTSLTGSDYWQIFYRGLKMDVSLGGYILLLSCIFMAFTPLVKASVIRTVFSVLSGFLLLVFWLVVTTDLELFENWGYHMDASPLLYMKTPKEALASVSNGLIVALLLLVAGMTAATYFFCRKYIIRKLDYQTGRWWNAFVFLVLGGLMIIPIRGGLNLAPLNSGVVFFHKTNMYANQAAINPVWNFIYEVSHLEKIKNKYRYMDEDSARKIVDSLYREEGTYSLFVKEGRPNVVVLLLESFTADAIEELGGAKGVTPNLSALAKEGILFSNVYATGNRSDRGLASVISAYPAHPNLSLMKYPNKTAARPRFPKEFEENGYHTRFYYAGDINFGGFRSYVTMSFQEMVTEDDFSEEAREKQFKWGIHDEFLFDRLARDVQSAPQPFMYMAFNMSSHEPFEVPMETKIKGETRDKKFLNAIYYADSCIGNFVRELKTSGIWDNTLLVLIADHGTIKIKERQSHEPEAFHIPMIFSGGALNVRDTVITTLGSQTDVVATLLGQLGMDYSAYKYSKNLLAAHEQPFAYYAFANAVAVITGQGTSIYNIKNNEYIRDDASGKNDSLLKAYLQVLDQDIN